MNPSSDKLNEAEHEHISTSLEVEQLEVNLFRSKSLWLPLRSRGVFGGSVFWSARIMVWPVSFSQVISQALVSATNCISNALALHVNDPVSWCKKLYADFPFGVKQSLHVRRFYIYVQASPQLGNIVLLPHQRLTLYSNRLSSWPRQGWKILHNTCGQSHPERPSRLHHGLFLPQAGAMAAVVPVADAGRSSSWAVWKRRG